MHELNAAFQVSFRLQRELRKVEFANFAWVVFIIGENDDFSNKAKLRQVSWEDHIFILAFRTERSLEYFVLLYLVCSLLPDSTNLKSPAAWIKLK